MRVYIYTHIHIYTHPKIHNLYSEAFICSGDQGFRAAGVEYHRYWVLID